MGCTPAVQNAFWFPLVAGSSRRGPRGLSPSPLPRGEGPAQSLGCYALLAPSPVGARLGEVTSLAWQSVGLRVTGSLSRWERAGVRASQFGLKAQPGVLRVTGSLSRWERSGVRVSQFGLLARPGVLRVTGSLTFPPLVKGGQGGWAGTASASSVYSPFARKDVRKRHASQAGEAAHAPSTSSFDRAKHGSLVH